MHYREHLKGTIIVDWLGLDHDKLAAEIPLESFEKEDGSRRPYLRIQTLANHAAQHHSKVFEAFASYKGSHTTDRPGYAYGEDWDEFLDALWKARVIAAQPYWEPPATVLSIAALFNLQRDAQIHASRLLLLRVESEAIPHGENH